MKKGFTLIEFLVGITITAFIFIVATNLVLGFLTVDSKSRRSQEVEQAKTDITADLTNTMQWASTVAFSGDTLAIDAMSYKLVNGRLLKDGIAITSDNITITNFKVDRFATTTEVSEPGSGTGLSASYFDRADLTSLKATRVDRNIDFNWGLSSPISGVGADSFSVRWSGQLEIPVAGSYQFFSESNDGIRVFVNNTQVIDTWTTRRDSAAGSLFLQKGLVDIRVEYYENNADAKARLSWASSNIARQIIPTTALYPFGTQTSFKVTMDITHTDSANVHDQVSLFIAPRLQNSQSVSN